LSHSAVFCLNDHIYHNVWHEECPRLIRGHIAYNLVIGGVDEEDACIQSQKEE
jgi:hypothetical protein